MAVTLPMVGLILVVMGVAAIVDGIRREDPGEIVAGVVLTVFGFLLAASG